MYTDLVPTRGTHLNLNSSISRLRRSSSKISVDLFSLSVLTQPRFDFYSEAPSELELCSSGISAIPTVRPRARPSPSPLPKIKRWLGRTTRLGFGEGEFVTAATTTTTTATAVCTSVMWQQQLPWRAAAAAGVHVDQSRLQGVLRGGGGGGGRFALSC